MNGCCTLSNVFSASIEMIMWFFTFLLLMCMLLKKNQWVNEEIKKEIKKYLETNDNEDTTIQNLWDAVKAVLREKFLVILGFLKKEEKSQIDNLTHHLNELEKE